MAYLFDQTIQFYQGQDAYNDPDKISPYAYAKGVNVKTSRNVLTPRWGNVLQDITFPNQFFRNSRGIRRTVKNLFETGRFQAAIPCYVPTSYYIIIVIGGFIYRYNIDNHVLTLLSETIKANANYARLNWTVADKYIVIFDYPNYPIIIDDTDVFRANPDFEVAGTSQPQIPISVMGTYNQSRLFIANYGNDFTAGDLVGNLATPYAPITFTEVLGPSAAFTDQFFTLNTNSNREPITAMGFIQVLDESTGVGPLLVSSPNSVYYYRSDLPRTEWEATRFGAVYIFNAGIAGQRAFSNMNSDVVFLSSEGRVHTFSTARNDAQKWSNVSVSREVENFLKYDDNSLIPFAFTGYFNNRVFVSANPYRVEALDFEGEPVYDIAHGGMVTLNLDNVATFRQDAPPVWDGLWTGIRPMDMIKVNNRLFVMSKDDTQINRLYEVRPDLTYDIGERGEENIDSIVYTREYDSGLPFEDKSSFSITLPFKDVEGKFKSIIDYKPSQYANFSLYQEFKHEAPVNTCQKILSLNKLMPHNFKDLTFTAQFASDQCDPVSNERLNYFRKVQFRIRVKGRNWKLPEINVKFDRRPDEDRGNACKKYNPAEIFSECSIDWNTIKEIEPCR